MKCSTPACPAIDKNWRICIQDLMPKASTGERNPLRMGCHFAYCTDADIRGNFFQVAKHNF